MEPDECCLPVLSRSGVLGWAWALGASPEGSAVLGQIMGWALPLAGLLDIPVK